MVEIITIMIEQAYEQASLEVDFNSIEQRVKWQKKLSSSFLFYANQPKSWLTNGERHNTSSSAPNFVVLPNHAKTKVALNSLEIRNFTWTKSLKMMNFVKKKVPYCIRCTRIRWVKKSQDLDPPKK